MGSIHRILVWRTLVWVSFAVAAAGAFASDLELGVVDAHDAPQSGVRLRVLVRPDDGGAPQELWRGETDAAGRARVPGPGDRFDLGFWRELATWHELWVEILIPAPWPLAVRVSPARIEPARPLLIGIPLTSRVRARIIDRRGRAIDDAVVRLFGRVSGVDGWREMDERTTGEAGEALFTHVPVGLEVLLFATGKRGRWQPAETIARAPVRPDAEGLVRLHFRSPNTEFHVRIVDEDGTPLAGERIWIDRRVDGVSIVPPDVAMPGEPYGTDEHGGLTVRLDRAVEPGRRVELVFSSPDPADESRRVGPAAQAVVDVTATLDPGRVALGEVVVRRLPLLAAGVVVDERGAPVPRAVVVLFADGADGPGGGGGSEDAPLRDQLGSISIPHPVHDERWIVRHARSKTRPDGAFVVRGAASERELFVVVRRPGYEETAAARLTPGDDGLRFVLLRTGE